MDVGCTLPLSRDLLSTDLPKLDGLFSPAKALLERNFPDLILDGTRTSTPPLHQKMTFKGAKIARCGLPHDTQDDSFEWKLFPMILIGEVHG
jgi:hypothetical protein